MILQRKLDAPEPVWYLRLLSCPLYGNNESQWAEGQTLTEINFNIWTIVGVV